MVDERAPLRPIAVLARLVSVGLAALWGLCGSARSPRARASAFQPIWPERSEGHAAWSSH